MDLSNVSNVVDIHNTTSTSPNFTLTPSEIENTGRAQAADAWTNQFFEIQSIIIIVTSHYIIGS